jgi:hypothetical protein
MSKVNSNSFVVVSRKGGKPLLCLNGAEGPSLVFFKINTCPGCKRMLPIFLSFSKKGVGGVRYLICDITEDKNVIRKSEQTNTAIKGVPCFIFYNNEKPFSILRGSNTPEDFNSFISRSLEKVATNKNYSYAPSEAKNYWTPELRDIPQSKRNEAQDEDGKFLLPDGITPYNTPWQATYEKLTDMS